MRARSVATAYARHLLDGLGERPEPRASLLHPAVAWARSGLMWLTGEAGGEPTMCPAPLTACADGALAALRAIAAPGALEDLDAAALLAERAALAGHFRNGLTSAGGACRLLECADGWIAVTLARPEDWESVPAWLETPAADWDAVTAALRLLPMSAALERGRELGLALAPSELGSGSKPPVGVRFQMPHRNLTPTGQSEPDPNSWIRCWSTAPRVVDLSSLWAGPLCSHLLQRLGADVIKVESWRRPDGARAGAPAFFDLLNAGKRSVALDFSTAGDRAVLHALIDSADIVIEGSRPRALRQLGIEPEARVARRPDLTWISLTAHGRAEPRAQWTGYGDDAGVAAGLSELMLRATGRRMFVGDAIADPLTGLHAALAAWAGWRAGGGGLIALALADVVRQAIAFDLPADEAALRARQADWTACAGPALPPRARLARSGARPLGADTAAVIDDLGQRKAA